VKVGVKRNDHVLASQCCVNDFFVGRRGHSKLTDVFSHDAATG